ncbi:hypothetical protein GCM10010094_49030 [Streptomyces flaveus]|uniref:Uncharacterized protein n=1 Tax=Streptomyces flaveus TaxID=66370 RepID=A0A917R1L6_9ACTN|nr:hypothetical protein GCM10010094_49030 [Streptomyces flaveus]
MPALRRADAPAHDPDPPTGPRGAGNGATSHNAPAPKKRTHPPEARCEPLRAWHSHIEWAYERG